MYREIIPNEIYSSKKYGDCVILGHKIHHNQLIIVLQNLENKVIHLSISNFDRNFIRFIEESND